jgi:hypothetical protein
VKTKYDLRPASPEEAGLFYAADSETDLANGCIGHVRMDFGRGEEFWHTWWPRGPEEWNSPEFKEELGEVVSEMRRSILKDLHSMSSYCCNHGGELPKGSYGRSIYGYVWRSENNLAIGIDCGSGFEDKPTKWDPTQGRLACLRLDDMKEFYSAEGNEV